MKYNIEISTEDVEALLQPILKAVTELCNMEEEESKQRLEHVISDISMQKKYIEETKSNIRNIKAENAALEIEKARREKKNND